MITTNIVSSILGFPRIGPNRELKTATEAFWAGKISEAELLQRAKTLRTLSWQRQKENGIEVIPSNDFSLYDQMLDTAIMVGAVPEIYKNIGETGSLGLYFAMARGHQTQMTVCRENEACQCGVVGGASCGSTDVPAQEMTKWFDTNYHYIVPEVTKDQNFSLSSTKALDEFLEAKALGIITRPVIIGPITFLHLAKSKDPDFNPLTLLPKLIPVYKQLLEQLASAGAEWVQVDEPVLVLDLQPSTLAAFKTVYEEFHKVSAIKIMLATYFGPIADLSVVLSLPVAGLHIDLVRAPEQVHAVIEQGREDLVLSLGVVNGRNIWKTDICKVVESLTPLVTKRTAPVLIAPSCSLLHVPVDLTLETKLQPEVKSWLSFATQKLQEIALISKALKEGPNRQPETVEALKVNAAAVAERRNSPLTHNPQVRQRLALINDALTKRSSPYQTRSQVQRDIFQLPSFPTTTIGSFPQTVEVRKARAAYDKGELSAEAYEQFLREETKRCVEWQEEIGLDVLVHGEFERNDMVQYFGEQLSGFAFSRFGWVQSYGSRCVRPPIIFGDVHRPHAMTVEWWKYAQSLTEKPMKGMLTGPVTILQWSFVRDDQPREDTCRQIAFAIRDEVQDLEAAGAKVIQIDEAALREGLPLRRCDWQYYLQWSVESFRLSSCGVKDTTQIHTHMCYSEFNDIISAIGAMDADVISIETARSKMELLDAFATYKYPNEIGPGVYDIHSPRVPSLEEIVNLLLKARERLSTGQLWVNPDCGLKTRKWVDVKPALVNMVEAAKIARSQI